MDEFLDFLIYFLFFLSIFINKFAQYNEKSVLFRLDLDCLRQSSNFCANKLLSFSQKCLECRSGHM